MNEIIFVTSNPSKIVSANQYFQKYDINLIPYDYDLIEPRSEDLEEIAKSKVVQAYNLVQKPCIALDAGFFIDSLNGWPATFVNFNIKRLGLTGILKLMDGIKNRQCSFKECLAYYDGDEVLYFHGESKGTLTSSIVSIEGTNNKWSKLWHIFVPDNHDKTLAEMSDYERSNRYDNHTSAFDEFANYYCDKKRLLKKYNKKASI